MKCINKKCKNNSLKYYGYNDSEICLSCFCLENCTKKINKNTGRIPKSYNFLNELVFVLNKIFIDECVIFPFCKDKNGYGQLVIHNGSKREKWLAHRLSYVLFKNKNEENMDCAHGPCHNPSCVNPLHLSFKTRKDHEKDKIRDKTYRRGSDINWSILTEDQVIYIKEKLISGVSTKSLCEEFKVKRELIKDIRIGKSWRHIPWPCENYKDVLNYHSFRTKFKKEDILKIRNVDINDKEKIFELSEFYSVKPATIKKVINRKTFKDIL